MAEIVARMIERSRDGRGGEDGRELTYDLTLGTHVIGRDAADVILDHGDVSRRHAELQVRSDGATIRDLGSKNGLRVGGVAVEVAALADGDEVCFGELCLLFEHFGSRIDTLLIRSGEPTIRRPRVEPIDGSRDRPHASLLAPLLAALVFAVLLMVLLLSN